MAVLWISLPAIALLLWAVGCSTPVSPTGDRAMAYQKIEGRSLSDIRLAAIEVFRTNQYQVKSAFGRDLVFERRGGTYSALMYGGWSDLSVWFRVKLRIEELSPDVNVLECNVYRVQNRGDNVFEEETLASGKSKQPFRDMLVQIKARVDALPPGEGDRSPPTIPRPIRP
jgi:hypothetical protein